MNRTQYLLRGFFFLLTILLLYYLNNKAGINLKTISKFKLETLNKIQSDSLGSKDKLDVLVRDTTAFNKQIDEDSSHARELISYLIIVVVLFGTSELIFATIKRKTFINND